MVSFFANEKINKDEKRKALTKITDLVSWWEKEFIMRLKLWLCAKRIPATEFAPSLEITATHLRGYMNGINRITMKVARRIERATGGEVSADEAMEDNPTLEEWHERKKSLPKKM
jgi:DNA-binding transcriptional regulator YdaS (Cro superfamily)